MIDYTGSTSSDLALLNDLTTLYRSAPANTQGLVNDIWSDLLAEIAKIFQPITDKVTETVNGVIQSVKDFINEKVSPIVNGVVEAVKGVIDDIVGGVSDTIQDFIDWIEEAINSISEWFGGVLDQIKTTIQNVSNWINQSLGNIKDWIVNSVNTVVDAVSTWLAGVVADVGDWITQTYQGIREWLETTVNNVGEWIRGVYSSISDFINRVVEGIKSTYESVKQTIEDKIQGIINTFNQIKQLISLWWNNTIANISKWFQSEVVTRFTDFTEGVKSVISLLDRVWKLLLAGDYEGAFRLLESGLTELGIPAPIQTLRAIVSATAYFWQTVSIQFVAMQLKAQREAEISLAMSPLDLGTFAQGVYKGETSEADFYNNAALAGITKGRARVALEANRALPTPGQVQEAFLRGEINLETHNRLLSSFGLTEENIDLIRDLYLLIPTVSDLIRMAVRETFTPEIAQKFGQYEGLPQEFVEWAAKQGLSKEWSSRYWAAHWELPSATMGFEMLHRGIITNEELTLLLRALDVMPFWRERIIKLSYNPLTRVDVRRMYQLGVIDQEQVKRSYLDLGYDNQKADWLTEFTIRYYTPEDSTQQDEFKALARSTYSAAYKKRVISEDEYRAFLAAMKFYKDDIELLIALDNYSIAASEKLFDLDGYKKDWQKLILNAYSDGLLHISEVKPMLLELGYDDNEVELELSLSDYNRQLSIRNMVAQAIHEQYVSYIIDNVGLHTILDQFNFTPEEIDRLEELWNIERSIRSKKPPLSDLRKFLTAGLINLEQFLDELRGEGYNEKYIELYALQLKKG